MRRQLVIASALVLCSATPTWGQSVQRSTEIYHIFDLKTASPKRDVIAAAEAGLRRNTSDADSITPIAMGPPPATPNRFQIVNPLADARMGGLAALMGASQMAQFKQATCDGAVWVANAVRRVRGSQQLRLTLCLFPYQGGYQLDVYGVDTQEKGGSLSLRLGRAIAKGVVGDPGDWTNKTIMDVVRSIRIRAGATVSYVEGQPELTGTPWNDEGGLLPSDAEKDR